MCEEFDAISERIVNDITAAFKKDPLIDEFGLIPSTQECNKSPVIHDQNEHKLALETWCVKHLYQYVYHRCLRMKKTASRNIEESEAFADLSRVSLLLNPDVSTIWNARKELIMNGQLDFKVDIHLSFLVLTRKPKCPEVFTHRQWLLKYIRDTGQVQSEQVSELLQTEHRFVEYAANHYKNNYHAWSYRCWLLDTFLQDMSLQQASNHLISEWGSSEKWICGHVSDHSGYHYRQFIIQHLLLLKTYDENFYEEACGRLKSCFSEMQNKESADPVLFALCDDVKFDVEFISRLAIFVHDLLVTFELLQNYPAHEAVWYHRRYILTRVYELLETQQENQLHYPLAKQIIVALRDFEHYVVTRLMFTSDISNMIEHHTQHNRIAGHGNLAKQHSKWLIDILHINSY